MTESGTNETPEKSESRELLYLGVSTKESWNKDKF